MSVVGSAVAAARHNAVVERLRAARDDHWRRAAIGGSAYFDDAWYLERNPDVERARVDPRQHFLNDGESEGRDPGPDFDSAAYVWMNPDAQGEALTHYHRALAAARLDSSEVGPYEINRRSLPAGTEGWIDEAWYTHAHAGTSIAELAGLPAWVHHVRSGLDPSPLFDVADYRARMPESEQDLVPLRHWLEHGGESALRPRVVSRADAEQPPYRPLIQHQVWPRSELAELDVVVMVHAFYPDLLRPLLDAVRRLPPTSTVLVSVTNQADAVDAHLAIDDVLGIDRPRSIKIVPNRGRNFAPLLCSFGEELRDHDLLLHLHTKKSLYSGNEVSEWRSHLVNSLVPSAAGVDAILSLFAGDPSVGVVQAPPWQGFPLWGNHWLGNHGRGSELFELLGVHDRVAGGYLGYPVGGMFWAKVDALVPLLDLGLTVGDFDREHGQTDRTLAHAIERTIPAAAAVAGFDTVEFDYRQAQWRRNWSAGPTAAAGHADPAALDTALDAALDTAPDTATLVSVDLFDTLVLRPALDPAALDEVLAAQVLDGTALTALRRTVEHRLRVDGVIAGDITLDEIYDAACVERPELADRLAELKRSELDLEPRLAIPRTWLIDRLRADRLRSAGQHRRRRYVLMTDTTQPLTAIEALLEQIGAADLFDDLYVSNACRARKDTGTMWDLVRQLEQPERWLHIGDNEFSDIQQASDRSIAWFHVPAPGALAQAAGVDSAVLADDTRAATQVLAGHGLAALASVPPSRWHGSRAAEQFGYGVLGPLTLGFVNWLTRSARDRAVDRLLFTARDGQLAFDVFNRIRPFLPADVPPADYFMLSRRVALGMLQHDGAHIADIFAAGDFSGTVADLLDARIGFRLPEPAGVALGREVVTLPADTDWLVDALQPFVPAITEHGIRERLAFLTYLRHLGIGADEHLGLVDLGYSGTAQKALAALIDNRVTGFYYVTTSAADELGEAALSCFGRDVTLGGHNLIYDKALTFELLCTAEHPQVERFEHDRAGLRIVFDPRTASSPETRRVIDTAQRAALRFAHDHIQRFGPEFLDASIDPSTVIDTIERNVGTLLPEVNDIFDSFVIDDRFCGRGDQSVTGRAVRPLAGALPRRPF
jgi:FMN phosphatase YigB (HAD superfamily)